MKQYVINTWMTFYIPCQLRHDKCGLDYIHTMDTLFFIGRKASFQIKQANFSKSKLLWKQPLVQSA